MDREEAIDRLKGLFGNGYSKQEEALNMAIKALEQEPCRYWQNGKCNGNTEVCEDAISRQDVLDLAKKGVLISNGSYKSVCKAINELPAVNPQLCEDAISRAEAVRVASGYCHPANVAKELANLPSVTPQPKTGHWIDDNENEIDARYGRHLYKCSECNEYADMFIGGTEDWWDLEKPNYCPNCGCHMVEPQESEDDEQIKVGTKVRTIKDKDFAGEEVFPVETIGIVEEIRKGGKLPYIIRANSDYWYYSRDMFEVIEDIEPQERSGEE